MTAVVQFFNSLMFAGGSLLLLWAWHREATALVAAYGIACLAANRRHAVVFAAAVQIAAAR